MAPSEVQVLEKEEISHSNNKRLQLKPFIMFTESTQSNQRGCIFLTLFSRKFNDQFSQILSGFLFYMHFVGIHLVITGV